MSSVELVVDAGDGSTTLAAASDVQVQQYREVRILLGATTVVINTIQPQSANGFATLQILIQGPSNGGNAAPSPASPQPNIEHPLQVAAASSDSEGEYAEPSWRVEEKWAKKMRGWLMVVATLVASMAFEAGTSQQPDDYYYEYAFMVSNTAAFGLALGSIILLMGENTFHGHFKLRVLRVFVVGAIFALAVAFCFAWFDSGAIRPLLFLGSLLVFLVFVTLLTWWYDRKRGEAIVWRLHSLSFGHLFRRATNAAEDAADVRA